MLAAAFLERLEPGIGKERDGERARAPLPLELREVRAREVGGEVGGAEAALPSVC